MHFGDNIQMQLKQLVQQFPLDITLLDLFTLFQTKYRGGTQANSIGVRCGYCNLPQQGCTVAMC